MTALHSAPVNLRPRLDWLDAFRGLAVVFMVIDHVALVTHVPDVFRILPGRLAMPMFFLLAGYLARGVKWRHFWVGYAGLALPFFVPWIDAPNVLVLWALGVLLLQVAAYVGLSAWVIAAVGLTVAANGWAHSGGGFYDLPAMFGLMALGSMMPLSAFLVTKRLPAAVGAPLAAVGRNPLAWYLGHLAALQALLVVTHG